MKLRDEGRPRRPATWTEKRLARRQICRNRCVLNAATAPASACLSTFDPIQRAILKRRRNPQGSPVQDRQATRETEQAKRESDVSLFRAGESWPPFSEASVTSLPGGGHHEGIPPGHTDDRLSKTNSLITLARRLSMPPTACATRSHPAPAVEAHHSPRLVPLCLPRSADVTRPRGENVAKAWPGRAHSSRKIFA